MIAAFITQNLKKKMVNFAYIFCCITYRNKPRRPFSGKIPHIIPRIIPSA